MLVNRATQDLKVCVSPVHINNLGHTTLTHNSSDGGPLVQTHGYRVLVSLMGITNRQEPGQVIEKLHCLYHKPWN